MILSRLPRMIVSGNLGVNPNELRDYLLQPGDRLADNGQRPRNSILGLLVLLASREASGIVRVATCSVYRIDDVSDSRFQATASEEPAAALGSVNSRAGPGEMRAK